MDLIEPNCSRLFLLHAFACGVAWRFCANRLFPRTILNSLHLNWGSISSWTHPQFFPTCLVDFVMVWRNSGWTSRMWKEANIQICNAYKESVNQFHNEGKIQYNRQPTRDFTLVLAREQMWIHFHFRICMCVRACTLLLNGSTVSLIKGVNKGPVLSNPQG